MNRKRRTDRNHVLYVITNEVTQEQYVGLTVVTSTVKHSLYRRMQKHMQRALAENKSWGLCQALRLHGAEAFTYGALQVVRGKAAAHAAETVIINEYRPALNTFMKGV